MNPACLLEPSDATVWLAGCRGSSSVRRCFALHTVPCGPITIAILYREGAPFPVDMYTASNSSTFTPVLFPVDLSSLTVYVACLSIGGDLVKSGEPQARPRHMDCSIATDVDGGETWVTAATITTPTANIEVASQDIDELILLLKLRRSSSSWGDSETRHSCEGSSTRSEVWS